MTKRHKFHNKAFAGLSRLLLYSSAPLLLSSCNDFLDILPLNEVVLENYWTEKADVNSVLNSCYETLEHSDALTRMGIWGELRSDNLMAGDNVPTEVSEILKENLQPSNPYCKWDKIYECINRCNTVCHYAPKVQAIDPNYREEEMRANVAEAIALRSLSYFYLIRTFRDVPYSTRPSIDDTQSYVLPATPFDAVLDSLITSLEQVKDDAVRRYYTDDSPNAWQNSSKITRWAIYALLADLYLWKGDWNNSIRYCDLVIDQKRKQYEELLQREGSQPNMDLIDSIPMILEAPLGTTNCGNSYTEIFGTGNSFESIFELYFSKNQEQKNTWVDSYYGNRDSRGRLSANSLMLMDVVKNTNSLFKRSDGRFYAATKTSGSSLTIAKYVRTSVSFTTKNVTSESDLHLTDDMRQNADKDAHWIIYRLSDMLLIKAEALIERAQDGDFDAAFDLINVVNKRANNLTATLKKEDYISSKKQMEDLLMEERQREFIYEGKRWYDLVRRSRRDGNTISLVAAVQNKFEENSNAIRIRLSDPNIIYFPYAKSELKVNPLLTQNPAFTNGEDSQYSR
ncbi:MAG: RagB/SusD family nutrient uptake outer membrane protein [Prevotella sp.]|nr:RagB/SusD family nutrient uptake outer membrane protein [Prevotella sp.]